MAGSVPGDLEARVANTPKYFNAQREETNFFSLLLSLSTKIL